MIRGKLMKSPADKPRDWASAIAACQARGCGYVIATIISTQGSTPRDGGSKMVIDAEHSYDTIGGGRLELLIVQQARELIARNQACQLLKPFPLAAEAAQCCGGNVTVMLECFAAVDWQLVLFGAGHVSRALVSILAGLPCRAQVIDNRPEFMQEPLPANCRYHYQADPLDAVAELPERAWVVIFTQDHALDFALCEQLLRAPRFAYLGMIGSATKALRFRKRLADAGISATALEQLHSPIGLPEVKGKLPMEVAVSIAAQLLSCYYAQTPAPAGKSTSWREIKALLQQPGTAEIHLSDSSD